MRAFDNEWILSVFENHSSFFTKRMFGGLAAYLFGRQMLVLVEPTKTGRWKWHGVLVCTDHAHHPAILKDFPQLTPHSVLKKWLYIDSRHEDFEPTMERVAGVIARDDQRFGIYPRPRKESVRVRRRPSATADLGATYDDVSYRQKLADKALGRKTTMKRPSPKARR